MFNLNSATLGAAFLGTTTAIALGVAPVQAAVFNPGDSIGFSGEAEMVDLANGDKLIRFLDPTLPATGADSETHSADFDIANGLSNFVMSTEAQFGDVINDIVLSASGNYAASANPWVSVNATYVPTATTGMLQLFLNPGTIDVSLPSGSVFEFDLTGTFSFTPPVGADAPAIGEFSVNIVRNADDTFNIVASTVPEPLTILGAGTAVFFGGAFKRQLNKKNKKGSAKA